MGVPRGSVIGSIYFLLHVHDKLLLILYILHCMLMKWVTVLIAGLQLEMRYNELGESFSAWFSQNCLYLNTEKTQSRNFHNVQQTIDESSLSLNNK